MALTRSLFNEDHEQYRDALRRFLDKEVAPHHARWEEQQHVDREVWLKAAEAGFCAAPCQRPMAALVGTSCFQWS